MSRLETALARIRFTRAYTARLLAPVPTADWFRMPPGGVTHIAWQVEHLAMAEYRLALDRVRGPRPDDPDLISESSLKTFARDSETVPKGVTARSLFGWHEHATRAT